MKFRKTGLYRIIIPIGLGSGLSMLGDSTVYTVLPLNTEAAGITLVSAGILMGINRLVRLFTNGFSGILYDFGNKRKIFLASLFLGGFSTLVFAVFTGFWPLFVSRILWGIAWSGILIGGTSILLAEADLESRGKCIGMHQMWILVGSAAGSILGGYLTDLFGYRNAMLINGIVSTASAVVVCFTLPEIARDNEISKGSFREFKKNYTGVFHKELYLAAAVLCISRFVLTGFVASFLSIITKEKISPWILFIGISTLSGAINGSKTVISIISAPVAGFLSDRLKNRWLALVISILSGSLGLFIISLSPPVFPILGLLLCSVPGSSIIVLIRTIAGELADKNKQGMAVGFVLTAGDLGSAVGPPLAFFVLPYFSLDQIFIVLSLLLLFTAAITAIFPKAERTV